MDSSRAEVCSGEVPCLEGRRADGDSFSTCEGVEGQCKVKHAFGIELQYILGGHKDGRAERVRPALERGPTYSDFEVHHFLSERTHFIVEAKAVFSGRLGREYGVQLPLF